MNELERKKIVEKIKKDLEAKENLCLKKEQLEEMIKNPVVHKYLELNKEIEKTEKYISSYKCSNTGIVMDTVEARINREFSKPHFSCLHRILFYTGTYYKDITSGEVVKFFYDDEKSQSYTFLYNEYSCLECREKYEVKDFEKFEKENIVLKRYGEDVNLNYYKSLYYQMLYNNYDFYDAQTAIIDAFNNAGTIVLSLKNNKS